MIQDTVINISSSANSSGWCAGLFNDAGSPALYHATINVTCTNTADPVGIFTNAGIIPVQNTTINTSGPAGATSYGIFHRGGKVILQNSNITAIANSNLHCAASYNAGMVALNGQCN